MWWFGVASVLSWAGFVVLVFSGWENWDHKFGCVVLGTLCWFGWFMARLVDEAAVLRSPPPSAARNFFDPRDAEEPVGRLDGRDHR
jgi:hypothetical protein